MKVAIIGAGFVGLSAGYELVKKGHEVTIFEAGDKVGGLAVGFKPKNWNWSLEIFYHHFFTNDESIISLADEIGIRKIISTPKTNSFIFGKEVQLDSPISLMRFPYLSVFDRIRMGLGLAFFKLIPNGMFLEKWTADKSLPIILGKKGYELIWRPLLSAKFGPFTREVNLAWFWARVYKRTTSLGYFEGGFQALADKLAEKIKNSGGEIKLNCLVTEVSFRPNEESGEIAFKERDSSTSPAKGKASLGMTSVKKFDKVVITVPAPLVDKLIGPRIKWPKINYLWGQTVVLELDQSLMKGYWLNVLEKDWPFLVAVEHTNFMDKKNYGGNVLVYLGNYLPDGDTRLLLKDEELVDLYLPYLKKINIEFTKKWIKNIYRFKEPFAQPVFKTGYSEQRPEIKLDNHIVVANMSMVYPWDRGTNYAVEMGQKAGRELDNRDK